MNLIEQLSDYGFECQAGPIKNAVPFLELQKRCDLWVIEERNQTVLHTSGKGGWRFMAFTNEAEAQSMADHWNRERRGIEKSDGENLGFVVRHLLDPRPFVPLDSPGRKGAEL